MRDRSKYPNQDSKVLTLTVWGEASESSVFLSPKRITSSDALDGVDQILAIFGNIPDIIASGL